MSLWVGLKLESLLHPLLPIDTSLNDGQAACSPTFICERQGYTDISNISLPCYENFCDHVISFSKFDIHECTVYILLLNSSK